MSRKYLWMVVVILIISGIWALQKNKIPYVGQENNSPTPSVQPSSTAVPAAYKKPVVSATASSASYDQAIKDYLGRRIQFDQYCQAIPQTLSYNNNTAVMLDNRSGEARTIKIDGKEYYLAGYGWRIVTLSSMTLPHYVKLDCGTASNVGTILLQ